jgi:hypothetical protein
MDLPKSVRLGFIQSCYDPDYCQYGLEKFRSQLSQVKRNDCDFYGLDKCPDCESGLSESTDLCLTCSRFQTGQMKLF